MFGKSRVDDGGWVVLEILCVYISIVVCMVSWVVFCDILRLVGIYVLMLVVGKLVVELMLISCLMFVL